MRNAECLMLNYLYGCFAELIARGLSPAIILCHHYVVLFGIFCLPWVITRGYGLSPRRGSKRLHLLLALSFGLWTTRKEWYIV